MRKTIILLLAVLTLTASAKPKGKKAVETWPDVITDFDEVFIYQTIANNY